MSFYLHDIYTILLIIYCLFWAVVSFFNKERAMLLIQYWFNQKYSIKYHRQESLGYKLSAYFITLLMISIILSFYLFNQKSIMSILMYFKIAFVISLWFMLKMSMIYFLSYLFNLKNYGNKYYYSTCSLLLSISLIFYPIILIISYYMDGILLQSYAVVVFYLFLVTYIVGKIILIKRLKLFRLKYVFYNILYLCCIEVIPYLGLLQLIDRFI